VNAIETYTRSGLTVSIYPDLDAPNPVIEFDFPGDNDLAAWEQGEVYGFVVTDSRGEHVDSCWGFYGADSWSYMIDSANDAADSIALHETDLNLHLLAY
jgi:hypothetical protein